MDTNNHQALITVLTQVPKGPGAAQMKSIANGYNDTYAAYYLTASDSHVAFTFTPAGGQSVENPIFVIQYYTARTLPKISAGGNPVAVNTGNANSGAFVSINNATNELWVTLNGVYNTPTDIQISP